MDKPRCARRVYGRESLSVFWVAASVFAVMQVFQGVTWAQSGRSDQDRIMMPVVQYLMDVGAKQYKGGLYSEAEKTLLQAQGYQQYLTAKERDRLGELLGQAHQAALSRKEHVEVLGAAEALAAQGRVAEARASLEGIQNSKFLTASERRRVAVMLASAKEPPSRSKPVVDGPKETPSARTPAPASPAPAATAGTPTPTSPVPAAGSEDAAGLYWVMKVPGSTTPSGADAVSSGPGASAEQADAAPAALQAGQGADESFMDTVTRKRNILRDHVRAVISDTRVRVDECAVSGEFDVAQQAIAKGKALVEENRLYLGPELVQFYSGELSQMDRRMATVKEEYAFQQEQQRRQEAVETDRQLRLEQDVEKQKAILELMGRAKAYLADKRYDEALAQVEGVLARDPEHNAALALKERIQDEKYLRQQIQIEQEYRVQRVETSIRINEAQTPYADEVTYPTNWLELNQKETRQPDRPVELDPDNVEVYRQLEKVVDLSAFNPQMPLSEAFDRLRNAVTPPLRIVILWNDLEASEILPSDPIGLDALPDVRLGAALESLLSSVSGRAVQMGYYPLGYAVEGGIIKVATTASLPKKMETRIYDISDLVTELASQMPMGNMQAYQRLEMAQSLFESAQSAAQEVASTSGGGGGGGTGGTGGTSNRSTGGGYGTSGGYGSSGGYGMGGMGMGGMGMGMMGGMGMGMMGGMGMGGYGMGGMGMGGMGMGGYGMGGMGGGYGTGGGYGAGGGYGMRGGGMDMSNLTTLIQNTIEPDSWYDISEFGEGTIVTYPQGMMMGSLPKKLVVTNTREVHRQVEQLLDELRKSLGPQVAIEARFLTVGKAFMEELGLDMDMSINLGGKFGRLMVLQEHTDGAAAAETEVPGSMGGVASALLAQGQYGTVLDDLQVQYLLKATQARNDTKTLSAPKATVMSGDPVVFNLASYFQFALPPDTQIGYQSGVSLGTSTTTTAANINYTDVLAGNSLQVTPTISKDKKHVLLMIDLIRNRLVGIRRQSVEVLAAGTSGQTEVQRMLVETPETESAQLSTRVMVPDGGTLLLGGQTVTTEVEKQVGVPILSKIPIIGRAFSTDSTVKDQQILLLLVKPRIILIDEKDQEALEAASAAGAHAF